MHIPSNPQQPAPIYFKTPRKFGLFEVWCEGIPRQINYLIDEADSTGKGSNATISYVHDFISHRAGETDAQINVDNCGVQNKNNFFIWYYSWRILCGLHKSILYSFLIAGHTKFSPDWCSGLIKQSFRRHHVSSLFDLMSAVDNSTVSRVNISKLCGLHDCTRSVPVYDWVTFLEPYFKKIPGISTFHHFRFSKDYPGVVFCPTLVDSPEIEFQILKNLEIRLSIQLPPKIVFLGLGEKKKNDTCIGRSGSFVGLGQKAWLHLHPNFEVKLSRARIIKDPLQCNRDERDKLQCMHSNCFDSNRDVYVYVCLQT